MLKHSQKINSQLFKEILVKGKNYHFKYFSVKLFKLPISSNSRFTCVIPKKVVKLAIKRNFLKRKIFNIIKNKYKDLPSSTAIIMFLKKGGEKLKFIELEEEINKVYEIIKKI